ncbi:hypothetical protein AO370_2036 [Moraxella catarrhalis]|uniref:Uncharacterized protein n=1 Tax=Moraxella catarrhalis TaxID=480 RepID=A0AB36DKH8_MORCA|nr:hypothetical protein AO370_2036 [Moraxella catarrhalis]
MKDSTMIPNIVGNTLGSTVPRHANSSLKLFDLSRTIIKYPKVQDGNQVKIRQDII